MPQQNPVPKSSRGCSYSPSINLRVAHHPPRIRTMIGSTTAQPSQLATAVAKWRHRTRQCDLERVQPFAWSYCLVSVACYLLLLSDVLRTGLGIHDLSGYTFLEPNALNFFGPYAYPVTEQLLANQTTTATNFWPYKYDTTSVMMRAIAKHLRIAAWPPCVTYDEVCDEQAGLPMKSVFSMIDSLVESVKKHQSRGHHSPNQRAAGHLTLRIKTTWRDRVHDYVFPWFFKQRVGRTCQAIHYQLDDLIKQSDPLVLCGQTLPRPHACAETWPNYDRSCAPNDLECQAIHRIWTHIPTRMLDMSHKFPNHTIDFVVLEGIEDFSRSGLTFQGSTGFDIVTLARVRRCTVNTVCETVMVDDYRYEGSAYVTNAPDWYSIVAVIRGVGQVYAWTRLLCLFVGCYVARSSETNAPRSFLKKVRVALRTMFLVPSQIATYGSVFPIACYVVAHLLDAPAAYAMLGQQLNSVMGVIHADVRELMRVCAVSMRSVWVLALVSHAWHWIQSSRQSSASAHGVLGLPEFSLTFVGAFTVFAQVRFTWLRNTNILEVYELVPSLARHRWRSVHYDSTYSFLYRFLLGTDIDYKCLAASTMLYLVLVLLSRMANWVFPRWIPWKWTVFTRTVSPYSAGTLWKSSGLVVSWRGPLQMNQSPQSATRTVVHVVPVHPNPLLATQASVYNLNVTRTKDAEAMVYLVNLGVMTNPLTYIPLHWLSGHRVGVYESKQTKRHVMLPYALRSSTVGLSSIDWEELELLFVVNTRDLDWWDLLQCG